MVILGTVKSVTDIREVEFQKRDGSKEKASVQGFIVKSCDDEVYVEGFGDVVKSLKEGGLQEGDIVQISATCSVRERTTDKGVFYSNNFRLNAIDWIAKKDRAF